jgi:hypothetical protein
MGYSIHRFKFNEDEVLWNQFLTQSKNSTFLFNRNFMDYHKDRFNDHSLMIFDENDNLVSCFPANEKNKTEIVSLSGLTYGSFIFEAKLKLPIIINVFKLVLKYYSELGFEVIYYKAFPRIYNTIPSDELDYCLFLSDAKLYRRDTAIVINQENKIKYSGNIRREAKKAANSGIIISESEDFELFWNDLLIPNLIQRFGVNPVHTTHEIQLLRNIFPENIKLFLAKQKDEILAGTVFFITENVAHCQYIAASDEGRINGALNLLFITLIDDKLRSKKYFDFGIVNESEGKSLNFGMLSWKERMGGRTISHDFYRITTSNHVYAQKIFENE